MSDASESESLSMLASESTESETDRALIVTLILGETGAGKSTFINYLANYFLGGHLYQPKIVIRTRCYEVTETDFPADSEVDPRNPALGQTKRCARYDFQRDHEVYRFIDTPGFSDPENGPSEEALVEDIITAVKEEGALHAIIVVLNGTVTRYTINIKSALTRIQGFLPRTFFDNFIVVYTNSSPTRRPILENLFKIPPKCTFKMDNACLAWKVEDWDQDQKECYPAMWLRSMDIIHGILRGIRQLAPQNTEEFRKILQKKNEIKIEISNCVQQIQNNHRNLEQLYELKRLLEEFQLKARQTGINMRMHEVDARFFASNKQLYDARRENKEQEKALLQEESDRRAKVKMEYEEELKSARSAFEAKKNVKIKVQTKEKNTICTTCQSACHKNCSVVFYNPRLGNPFKTCCAMLPPERSTCKCGHSYREHVCDKFEYQEVPLSHTRLNHHISEQCLQTLSQLNDLQLKIEMLSFELNRAQNELDLASDKLGLLDQAIGVDREEEQSLQQKRESALEAKDRATTEFRVFTDKVSLLSEKIAQIEKEIQLTEGQLNEARRLMTKYCLELRAICPKYDLVEELEIIKELLSYNSKTLRDVKQKRDADAYIDSLVTLLEDERREGTLIFLS